ncbi:hypothetical protein PULV_a1143 [Pseudoalteromonas ulvae UL12]|uniref:Uncharacterized protein n=1 Tax=Pseudoalteromonas ulvae TaxID=107327 RepID=A0A244CSD1_PSEDV|nr:hypothetical protein [Pseudoalteromonas ulvae]MBE0363666.1 hypothetical protein [Pseudoalteromonas ulvae UL12]OUL58515.1 hypothetical protein B1199_09330 [Pseudoalteromonas ulvae]
MVIVLSGLCALWLYILAVKKGMPAKRWCLLGGLCGPMAWCLFNVHYRRAWLRQLGDNRSLLRA